MPTTEYKICPRCCMDTSADEFELVGNGCYFCELARKSLAEIEKEKINLNKWIERIKKDGEDKEYNCLIGLSGGIDSSFTLHKAIELGLRPLCFTVDTGYNKPAADENILKMVETLKVPFFRYTIDLEKFRELQGAFIKAGLKNIEIPTDAVLMATTYEVANKVGIKWILSGGNVASESVMPFSWGYNARDAVHIKGVYKKITGKKLTGLPICSLLRYNYLKWVRKIKTLYLLDYI